MTKYKLIYLPRGEFIYDGPSSDKRSSLKELSFISLEEAKSAINRGVFLDFSKLIEGGYIFYVKPLLMENAIFKSVVIKKHLIDIIEG